MALIGNQSVLSKHPGRDIGGGAIGLGHNRTDFSKVSRMRGVFNSAQWEPKSGVPDGYRPPYAWVLPMKDGALRSNYEGLDGSATLAANLAGGLNAEGALSGVGTISSASTSLLGNILAAISGSGTLSAGIAGSLQAVAAINGSGSVTALLDALADLDADLTGAGDLTGSLAIGFGLAAALAGAGTLTGNLAGSINAEADLSGVGSLVAAITGAKFMTAGLTGTGSLSVADLRGIATIVAGLTGSGTVTGNFGATPASLSADIVIGASDPLSPENLAAAVWNALAAVYNNPGSMGEKMNDAGGAADPWDDPRALTLAKFLGLK